MKNILIVGLGGFIGSGLRYVVSGWIQQFANSSLFAWGTMGVNVIGCFLIGILGGLADSGELIKPAARLFLLIGILGGFTTFSTFGYETLAMVRDGEMLRSFGYVGGHLLFGLGAVWIGYGLSSLLG